MNSRANGARHFVIPRGLVEHYMSMLDYWRGRTDTHPPLPVVADWPWEEGELIKFGSAEVLCVLSNIEEMARCGLVNPTNQGITAENTRDLDAFTKMRVHLAMRLFSNDTLAHLENVAQTLRPHNSPEFLAMLCYFDATNAVYTEGLMAKHLLRSVDDVAVNNVLGGWENFWAPWHKWWSLNLGNQAPTDHGKDFLAPVTWEETSISITGWLGLLFWRFKSSPGSAVSPRRVSQSALEGVFGYIRSFSSGGASSSSVLRGVAAILLLKEDQYLQNESAYLGDNLRL
jgi:hypothetical protein